MKAKNLLDPPLMPWERAMQKNTYVGQDNEKLLELLSDPRDDWQEVVQAMAWNGGGLSGG